uniref:Uncharacterized protein n=1 Tax=Timema poppense TaxID=170557 RepID=A0A7R9D382_TIMPO|nr:unnamed protein product [Timema poppensis]
MQSAAKVDLDLYRQYTACTPDDATLAHSGNDISCEDYDRLRRFGDDMGELEGLKVTPPSYPNNKPEDISQSPDSEMNTVPLGTSLPNIVTRSASDFCSIGLEKERSLTGSAEMLPFSSATVAGRVQLMLEGDRPFKLNRYACIAKLRSQFFSEQDSNLDLLGLGSQAQHKTNTSANYTTEAGDKDSDSNLLINVSLHEIPTENARYIDWLIAINQLLTLEHVDTEAEYTPRQTRHYCKVYDLKFHRVLGPLRLRTYHVCHAIHNKQS